MPSSDASSDRIAADEPSVLAEGAATDRPTVSAADSQGTPGAADRAAAVEVPGYEVQGELGRGGMGVVYKARHLKLNRLVALKMVLAGGHAGSAELQRFLVEAEAVAALQHVNIVQVFEIGQHRGLPYMALEYVNGGSLADRLREGLTLAREAAWLVEQLAHGVAAAHSQGIIHRDLKPHNVLLAIDSPLSPWGRGVGDEGISPVQTATAGSRPPLAQCTPKVTDFGLAKKVAGGSGLTQTGAVMGTPSYMAPEQAEGMKDIGPAADVYALGAILYECLTGRPPFRAATPMETLMQVVMEEPVRPTQLNGRTPRDLETICLKCLAKESHKRYASALDLAEDLRRFQRGEPIFARPAGTGERLAKWVRRRPVVAGLLAVVLLVTLAGMAGVAWAYRMALDERNIALAQEKTAQEEKRKAETERQKANSERERAEKGEADAKEQWSRAEMEKAAADNARGIAETKKKDAEESRKLTEKANEQVTRQLMRAEGLVYLGQFNEACDLLKKNDLLGCRLALDQTRWDFRGPEYGYLVKQLRGKCRSLVGHSAWVMHLAAAPDGKRLYSAASDGTIKAWDLRTGQELLSWNGPASGALCLAVSADGKRLFGGARDATIKVWDTANGREVRALRGHQRPVLRLAVTEDGKRLVSGAGPKDNTVTLWDAAGRTDNVSEKEVAPKDNTVKVWDLEEGKELFTLADPRVNGNCLALAPDGKRIFTGSGDRTVKVWDLQTGKEIPAARLTTGQVQLIALSANGKRLAVVPGRGIVKVFDIETGKEAFTLRPPDNPSGIGNSVHCLAVSADGSRVFTGSFDHNVRIWDLATGKDVVTLRGHDDPVECLALRPDGKQLISAGRDRSILVWDLDAVTQSRPFRNIALPSVAGIGHIFSLDGKRLLSPGSSSVWDLETGKEICNFSKDPRKGVGTIMSGNGKRLFLPGRDQSISLWDVDAGKEIRVFRGPPGVLGTSLHVYGGVVVGRGLASPDGQRLFFARDKTVLVWDTDTGKELHALQWPHVGGIMSMTVSPDGTRLFCGSVDPAQIIKVWDVATGKELYTLRGYEDEEKLNFVVINPGISSLAVSADGKRLFSGSSDRTIKAWDLTTGKRALTLRGHANGVYGLAVAPDGKRLFSWSHDKTIKLWDLGTGKEILTLPLEPDVRFGVMALRSDGKQLFLATTVGLKMCDLDGGREARNLRGHKAAVTCMALAPDGKRLYTGDGGTRGGSIRLWDLETGQALGSVRGHDNRVLSLVVSPDGTRLFSGCFDGTIKVWDSETGDELLTLKGQAKQVTNLAVSPDGKRLFSSSLDDTIVKVWDLQTGKDILTLKGNPGGVGSLAVSADGKRLYVGNGRNAIKVWEVETGKELSALGGHTGAVTGMVLSADGKTLYSGTQEQGGGGQIKAWDLATGKAILTLTLREHTGGFQGLPVGWARGLAVARDGKRLFSAGSDQTIRVWDLQTGKESLILRGHTYIVSSLACSPDGKRLYSASLDRTVKVWDVEAELAASPPASR